MVTVSGPPAATPPVAVSPLLWPLVGYLGLGTFLLFLVTMVEGLAFFVMPGEGTGRKWHELPLGWMAIYPLVLPVILARALGLVGLAIPARILSWCGRALRRLGRALSRASRFVRAVMSRAGRAAWVAVNAIAARARVALADALRAVREASDSTVRRVRTMLGRG